MRLLALSMLAASVVVPVACSSFDALPTAADADGGSAVDAAPTEGDAGDANASTDSGLGSDAVVGPVVTIAQEKAETVSVAVDAQYIYWWSVEHSSIMKADKRSLAVTTVAARTGQTVSALAVDSSGIYWLEAGPPPGGGGTNDRIMALAPGASTAAVIAARSAALKLLALDATHVLSTDSNGFVVATKGASSAEAPLSADGVSLTSDGVDAFYTFANSQVCRLAIGAFTTKVIDLPGPRQLTLEGSTVYGFMDADGGSAIFKTDKTESSAPASAATQLAQIAGGPLFLAIDNLGLVWANASDGTIKRVLRSGGAPSEVVSGVGAVNAIAADTDGVYWTSDSGQVGWARH